MEWVSNAVPKTAREGGYAGILKYEAVYLFPNGQMKLELYYQGR